MILKGIVWSVLAVFKLALEFLELVGGLKSTSKWKSEVTYKDTLEAAVYNVKGEDGNWSHTVQTWEFSKEDIDQVKQYVSNNGMGNTKNGNVLAQFIYLFTR